MPYDRSFDSWEDFVRAATDETTDMPESERSSRRVSDVGWNGEVWSGTKTWDECVELAYRGWPEGVERLSQRLRVTQDLLPVRLRRREYELARVGPGTLDMGRYLMGHPEPYVVYRDVETDAEGPGQVTILFNMSVSSGIAVEELFRRGAAVCALVDSLETAGRRVSVKVAMCTHSGDKVDVTVQLKRHEDPLDLERVAFAVAHAAAFRRLGFAVWELAPREVRYRTGIREHGGYGQVYSLREPGALCLDGADLYRSEDPAVLRRWLVEQLKAQGVEWEVD